MMHAAIVTAGTLLGFWGGLLADHPNDTPEWGLRVYVKQPGLNEARATTANEATICILVLNKTIRDAMTPPVSIDSKNRNIELVISSPTGGTLSSNAPPIQLARRSSYIRVKSNSFVTADTKLAAFGYYAFPKPGIYTIRACVYFDNISIKSPDTKIIVD